VTAGYSNTPLPAKLGITAGRRVLLVAKPATVDLGDLSAAAVVHTRRGREPYDVALLFAPDRRSLAARFGTVAAALTPPGALWVCWPKRSSGVPTDLTEGDVRTHGLDCGLVDVKVAAIDAVWSGLKFVRRLADR